MDDNTSVPAAQQPQSLSSLQERTRVKRGSSLITPPYWQHARSASCATQASLERAPPISLEDNTGSQSETHGTLWAKGITVDDYVIVRGNPTGIGAYVVWLVTVETLDGGPMTIRKRYSEFDDLRQKIVAAFPLSTKASLPPLPPKSAIYKFRPKFLERRKDGLNHFLTCILLNPDYAGSVIVKEFIFANGCWQH